MINQDIFNLLIKNDILAMLNMAYVQGSKVSEYRPPGLVVGYPDRSIADLCARLLVIDADGPGRAGCTFKPNHERTAARYSPMLTAGLGVAGGAVMSFVQWWVLRGKESWVLPVGKVRFFALTGSGQHAFLNHIFDQAGQVWHVQLFHNPASIGFYCFWRKEQNFGDLCTCFSFHNPLQHFSLSEAELI